MSKCNKCEQPNSAITNPSTDRSATYCPVCDSTADIEAKLKHVYGVEDIQPVPKSATIASLLEDNAALEDQVLTLEQAILENCIACGCLECPDCPLWPHYEAAQAKAGL